MALFDMRSPAKSTFCFGRYTTRSPAVCAGLPSQMISTLRSAGPRTFFRSTRSDGLAALVVESIFAAAFDWAMTVAPDAVK